MKIKIMPLAEDENGDVTNPIESITSLGLSQKIAELIRDLGEGRVDLLEEETIQKLLKLQRIEAVRNAAAVQIREAGLASSAQYDPTPKNEGSREYHRRSHSEDVETDSASVFEHYKTRGALIQIIRNSANDLIERIEMFLMAERAQQLSADWHDADQDENPASQGYDGGNERRSAQGLASTMNEYEFQDGEGFTAAEAAFTEKEIDITTLSISATRAHPNTMPDATGRWPEDTYIYQYCEEKTNPPDDLTDLLRRVICDADLASFGKPWTEYWRNMAAYFREINPGITEIAKADQLKKWQQYLQMQRQILSNHSYKTDAGEELFGERMGNFGKINLIASEDHENTVEMERSYEAALARNTSYSPDGIHS